MSNQRGENVHQSKQRFFVGDGQTKEFELGFSYQPGSLRLQLNGITLSSRDHYSETDPERGLIQLTRPPAKGFKLAVYKE
jgi:hypothetical protein